MVTKTVRINVTKRDIKMGKRHESKGCPIALASIRKGLIAPYVSIPYISFGKPGHRKRRHMPERAINFVHAFDWTYFGRAEFCRPFTFTIKV